MTAKAVDGEFITLHQLLLTLWAKPTHIAKTKAKRSPVLKIDVAASVDACVCFVSSNRYFFANFS